MPASSHVPVLLGPALEALRVRQDGVYIDCTYGRGGHAGAIFERLGPDGRLVVIDQDPEAIVHAAEHLGGDPRVSIRQASFAELGEVAHEIGIHGRTDGLFMDLGVSSPQLDEPERGFSFQADGPLDMRMNPEAGESAAEWLARAPEAEIARVIKEYGEERFARRIARSIVTTRTDNPILRTGQLAGLVAAAVPGRPGPIHPATRTFQAIRIHVNQELEALEKALAQGIELLADGGRFVVISFHSLEDRLVKQAFQRASRPPPADRRRPVAETFVARLREVGKLVRPGPEEEASNPRARSSRMRVAEKLPAAGARP